jgi:hypothetical protein
MVMMISKKLSLLLSSEVFLFKKSLIMSEEILMSYCLEIQVLVKVNFLSMFKEFPIGVSILQAKELLQSDLLLRSEKILLLKSGV